MAYSRNISGLVQWRSLLVVAALGILCALGARMYLVRRHLTERAYKIGWESAYPEQFAKPDGTPTGVVVELVQEAARRRGIRLIWEEHRESSEAAILSHAVDLWPLITITEERKARLHFSRPYLHSYLAFWVLPGSGFTTADSLRGKKVASRPAPINVTLLKRFAPGSVGIVKQTPAEAITSVCSGETAAALLEQDDLIHSLIRGAGACGERGLAMIQLPNATIDLAIGSSKAASEVADALRDEIDVLFGEGEVDRLFQRWGYISGRNSASLEVLLEATRGERVSMITTGLLLIFLALAVFQTRRYGIESRKARAAEELQRKSNSELLETQRIAGLGVWSCDFASGHVHWSDELFRMAGLDSSKRSLSYEDRVKVFSQESAERLHAAVTQASEVGTPYQLDLEMLRSDGATSWVTVRGEPIHAPDGRIIGLRGTALDITARRRSLEALASTERRLQLALESAALGTYEWVVDTGQLIWNPQAERIFGYHPGTFRGSYENFLQTVDAEDRAAVVQAISDAQRGHAAFVMECRIVLPDGKNRWVLSRGAFLQGERGESVRMYGVVLDITAQKNLEKQLQQAQKLESVGRLAGGLAHDFNNMLTVIMGYAEQAREAVAVDPGLSRKMNEILKAAGRSRDLTQKLLGFSRQQVIEPVPLDLNVLLGDLQEPLARLIGEDIVLVFHPSRRLWPVVIDPSQVNQILLNLLVNARDAMPAGGEITVQTSNVMLSDQDCEEYPGAVPGSYVMLSVADTGVGMSPDTVAHIFEPFFTTKGAEQGTGLGLATVYGIVSQNRGFIQVKSVPGQGSKFQILLPRIHSEPGQLAQDYQRERRAEGTGTILLVEDNDLVRDLLAASLEELGYTVLNADSPEKAISFAERQGTWIDGMLSDVVMPRMNGLQLREKILAMHPETRILFMSGYTSNIVTADKVGTGLHFIQKPFTVDELGKRLSEVMSEPAPQGHPTVLIH